MRSVVLLTAVLSVLVTALSLFVPAPSSAAVTGDVNCDTRINSVDASLILQRTSGRLDSLECDTKADVNSDGSVNSIDALFVLQYDAGLLTSFPTCDLSAGPVEAQNAIDAAGQGNTVCLRGGSYDQLFVYRKTAIEILGAGSQSAITDDICILVIESRDIAISDFRASDCSMQGALVGDSSNVTLRRLETDGGPMGFLYQRSTGRIEDSRAHDHSDFGAIIQINSDVTIDGSTLERNDIGILSQDNTTLRVNDSNIFDNSGGGVFTIQRTGRTYIDSSSVNNNGINAFFGVPGCANLPPADPNPPQCYLDDPQAYVSDIEVEVDGTTLRGSVGPGVVLFPGVSATVTNSRISDAGLTGLFAWGARLTAAGNVYDNNVENAIECRAYPGPSTGDRGMCDLTFEHMHNSQPLEGNRLGGGFVSEGGEFRLTQALIEDNWGIGVQVLHGGKGIVSDTTIRNNGGTAFCVSGETWITLQNNTESGNRAGSCAGHP